MLLTAILPPFATTSIQVKIIVDNDADVDYTGDSVNFEHHGARHPAELRRSGLSGPAASVVLVTSAADNNSGRGPWPKPSVPSVQRGGKSENIAPRSFFFSRAANVTNGNNTAWQKQNHQRVHWPQRRSASWQQS